MKIDAAITNMPGVNGQTTGMASARQYPEGGGNTAANMQEDKAYIKELGDRRVEPSDENKVKTASPADRLRNLKAVFALDDDKKVVIRFLDKSGKTVRQFPPEEYVNTMKKLNEIIENLYSKKV